VSELWKVEGAGNDFLLGTGVWAERLAEDPDLVRRLCRRRLGIGADGTLAVFPEGPGRVRLVYRNADGSEAGFCANGTRCAARAAVEALGLPPRLEVLTDRGPVAAEVDGERVALELPEPEVPPEPVHLEAAGRTWEGWFAVVGVPHLVLPVEGLEGFDLAAAGPALRAHPALGAEGANVNLVEARPDGGLSVRSYERGVEGETLSCGSGVVAAALAWLAARGGRRLACAVRSGDTLEVEALGAPPACRSRLIGPARWVARLEPSEELLAPAR